MLTMLSSPQKQGRYLSNISNLSRPKERHALPGNTATFHSRPDHYRCSERSSSRTVEKSSSESYEPAGNSESRPSQFTQSLIWSPSTSSTLTKPTTSGLDSPLKAILTFQR